MPLLACTYACDIAMVMSVWLQGATWRLPPGWVSLFEFNTELPFLEARHLNQIFRNPSCATVTVAGYIRLRPDKHDSTALLTFTGISEFG